MFDFLILQQGKATATAGSPATAETLASRYASNSMEKKPAAAGTQRAVTPITAVKPATVGTPGLLETPVAEETSTAVD
jgi:hypothetical protein